MLKALKHYFYFVIIAFIVFTLCRAIFYFSNINAFTGINYTHLLFLFFSGLRFDASSISLILVLFSIVFWIPLKNSFTKTHRIIIVILFIVPLVIGVLFNLIDVVYFKFIGKRTTADIILMKGVGAELKHLIPQFIRDYWIMFVLFFTLVTSISYIAIKRVILLKDISETPRILNFGLLLLFAGVHVLAFRGGIQPRPLKIISAGLYTQSQYVPIVINTPFSFYTTFLNTEQLEEKSFMEFDDTKKWFNPIKVIEPISISKNKPNVFIIVLESFSTEYVGFFNNGKGVTPFFDSLCTKSIVCANFYNNSKKSIEGIPTILSGIPTLMEAPYVSSIYAQNRIKGIGNYLKELNYETAFFHGGTNGTMGLNATSQMLGFNKYYGRTEYNNNKEYDGHWGIWDMPFFNYTVKEVSKLKAPFCATLFSLSSHHPFELPKEYNYLKIKDAAPITNCIKYTDLALKQFFTEARKQNWFKNTVFIITADHTGPSVDPVYANLIGIYKTPMIIYSEGFVPKKIKKITQQIDILPTVLAITGYSDTVYNMGFSVFDTINSGYAFSYLSGTYQLVENDFAIQYNNDSISNVLRVYPDSMKISLNDTLGFYTKKPFLTKRLQSIIQRYNSDLINNKTVVK